MGEDESLSDWYEQNIKTSLEDAIEPELDRIKQVFNDVDGSIKPADQNSSVSKQVCSVAIGKTVANLAGKADTNIIETSEFYSAIEDDKKNIRANISNIKKRGFLQQEEKGSYKINPSKVEEILDYILGGQN